MDELIGFERQLAAALEEFAGPRQQVDTAAIARRAALAGGRRPMRPAILDGRSRATDTRSALRGTLVAAVAAAVLVAGGLLIGTLSQRTTVTPSPGPSSTITPPPSTDPSPDPNVMGDTFSCAEAQAAAARTTTTWAAGPAPADPSTAENGWIAVWGGGDVPELFLVDPTTGEPCSLARFDDYPTQVGTATPDGPLDWTPSRGPLVWSPDGQALAFVVAGDDQVDLFVWSPAGLAGPLGTNHDMGWPGTPSWSPDGSRLAVPEPGHLGIQDITAVRILDRTGALERSIPSGCACYLDGVHWSDSGRIIAVTIRDGLTVEDGIVAGSVDGDRLQAVPILADPVSSAFIEQVLGFVDDETILLANPSLRRFTGRRLDGAGDRDLGPTRVLINMTENGPLSLAPDRSAWLFSPWPSPGFGILEVADGATRRVEPGSADVVGWAPNSRFVGYVNKHQGAEQGVWIARRDGTGARRVVAGPYVLEGAGAGTFAWQPVWPVR